MEKALVEADVDFDDFVSCITIVIMTKNHTKNSFEVGIFSNQKIDKEYV